MGNIWFTADMHLGHANIIKYCNRPFKSLEDMDYKLIKNWNDRVKKEDTVFHVGDFCFKNSPAMVDIGEGSYEPANYYESKLNGKIIFINGSHDNNNTCKTPIEFMWLKYGGKNILMFHDPSNLLMYQSSWYPRPDFVICGHVHEKWKVLNQYGITMINVGVDQWDYRPIDINDILKAII